MNARQPWTPADYDRWLDSGQEPEPEDDGLTDEERRALRFEAEEHAAADRAHAHEMWEGRF